MKNLLLNNVFTELWKEANTPVDYVVAFWITALFLLASISWVTFVVKFILEPSVFDNVTWGLIDYI